MTQQRIAAELPPAPEATVPRGAVAFRFPAIAVAGLALLVRLAVLAGTQGLPFFRGPIGDAKAYLDWSARIAAGDWLGRAEGLFYQAPLYPYLLASLRATFGLDGALLAVRLLQIGFDALACGVLVEIGARAHSRAAGLASGLALALYAPSIVLDVQLAKESLVVSLGVLALGVLLAAARAPGVGLIFGAGVLLGAICLLRESALLLAAAVGVWTWIAFPGGGQLTAATPASRQRSGARARRLLLWGAGLLLMLAPVATRNFVVGGELALTTAQAGPNFYIGNHAGATGSYTPLRAGRGDAQFERRDATELAEAARGERLSARAVSAYWFSRGFGFWRNEPIAAASLLMRKLRLALQAEEITDIEADWIYARASPLLRALGYFGHFGVLAPLALMGLLWDWRGLPARDRTLLLAWLGAAFAGLVLFYVLGRYRALLLPPLFLLAGIAISRLASCIGRRRRLPGTWTGIAFAASGLLVFFANGPGRFASPPAPAEANLALAYALEGRFAEAEDAYRRALALDPEHFGARLGLGNLLLVGGRSVAALPHLERAAALQPQDVDARRQLAIAAEAVRASSTAPSGAGDRLPRGSEGERAP